MFDSDPPTSLEWSLDGQAIDQDQVAEVRPLAHVYPGSSKVQTQSGVFDVPLPDDPAGARPVRTVGVTARWGKRDASALPLQVRPLPAEMETGFGASFRVLLVSCFYRNKDASGLAGGVAFRLAHSGRPPDRVLTVGDQVYLDNPPSGAIHLTERGFAKSFETKYRDNWQTDAVGAGYAEILRVAPVAAINAAACYAVAGLLGTAAALVAGRPNRFDRPRRVAVTGVLASRGMLGLLGRTDLFSPTSTGDRFRRLDRRFYSPLCLTLAALTWLSLPGKKG